jgi:gluconokinase
VHRPTHRGRYVVMGVAGAGKSVIGAALARTLGVPFLEGDLLHPAANVARMSAGIPLTDDDRHGWLTTIAAHLRRAAQDEAGLVVSCSALKRSYRALLRDRAGDVQLVFLHGTLPLVAARLAGRRDHFMPPALLESQFAALEPPGADEGAWYVDIADPPEAIVASLVARIAAPPRAP